MRTPPLQKVSVECPAKTNLVLRVGKRHEEWGGRHELHTIYCAIGVYDLVTVRQKESGTGFSLDISGKYLGDLAASSADLRANHAVRALMVMARESCREPDISISLEKHIPVGAGLGGGSSDCAGTILGLNRLWGLNWPLKRLQEIAAELGADMPFCLTGGYAYGSGYGEEITLMDRYDSMRQRLRNSGFNGQVMVGAYRAELSTPEVYAMFDEIGAGGRNLNDLQQAAIALHPRSGIAVDAARQAGATQVFVSGSGPSVVAYVPRDRVGDVESAWRQADAVDRILYAEAPAEPVVHDLE